MYIQSRNVYYNEKFQALKLMIEEGKIKRILPYRQDEKTVDYGDKLILPGLVDIHNHGYHGCLSNTATAEWLKEWTEYLPSEGVTATLASISSAPLSDLRPALKNIGQFIDEKHRGTHILGVYEEGPFISDAYCGAQDLASKIIANEETIKEFDELAHHHLCYVMMAIDELKGDYRVIDYCRKMGMQVAIGHSGATFAECAAAIAAGARSFTHTFNAMKGLHHREPGCVGAAMYFDEAFAELICDGVHVEKHAANILARLKGKDRLILITDAVSAKGYPVGTEFFREDRHCTVCADGVVRMDNGTIAGSCNKLNKVLRFAIKEAKIDRVTAINAATINPCRLLHFDRKGLIEEGYDADLVVFDDDFNVQAVYLDGERWVK